jgi:cephalosporin-C deacetylase-like acetyl esterase
VSLLNRRGFLTHAGAFVSAMALSPMRAFAASSYSREFPDMLLAYLAGKLNALAQKWDRERDNIETAAQLEDRDRFVREKFREMVHGFPERNPLNPVVVATHEREGYRVENVMFQSRPDFWATGNLYVPASGKGPFPGIISPCGHYPNSRMEPEYQFAYMNLVKAGFVVLAYDPVGQGERRQYWNPQTNQTEVASASTYEHSMPGQVLLLLGEDLTHYRIWDGMRAIDYLLTRPEVHPEKIGCAGHSGGATLTKFISSLDERIQCAAVIEGGAGNRWPVRFGPGSRVGPSDVEQNLFPAAIYGVDSCDILISIAPRPLLVAIENYSPAFNRTAETIKARYELLGVPEKFGTEEANDPHSWTPKLRLATTDWFCRWFYDRRGPDREPEFQPEPLELLYCTPDGSIRYSQTGQTIFSLMLQKQEELPPKRQPPANRAQLTSLQNEITGQIRRLLGYRKLDHPLGVRNLVTTPRKGYSIEKLEFLSEPGIFIPAWVFVPESKEDRSPATLFVHEAGKEVEGGEFGLLERLARKGQLVIAVDVRGIGGTRPPHADNRTGEFAHLFNVETAMSYMAWYMDESLFGMRVQDVVRSMDYALSRPDVDPGNLRVIGKGAGALWVLYAAALDPRITTTIADSGLVSYRSLAQVDRYLHGAHLFIRDVLKHFDLPQVAAAVADRKLIIHSPVDPMKKPVGLSAARRAYEWTSQAYQSVGGADRFQVLGGRFGAG